MGVGCQVASGDERAHVDVVGKDVVTDELTEEKDQVRELHSFTLISWLRCDGDKKDLNNLIAGSPCQIPLNKYAVGNEIKGKDKSFFNIRVSSTHLRITPGGNEGGEKRRLTQRGGLSV